MSETGKTHREGGPRSPLSQPPPTPCVQCKCDEIRPLKSDKPAIAGRDDRISFACNRHLTNSATLHRAPPQVNMLRRHALRARLPLHLRGAPSAVLGLRLRQLATATSTAPASSTSSSAPDIFANGTNAYYAEEMYRHWRQDPKSVHASWDAYFSGLDKGIPSQQAFQAAPGTFIARPADGSPQLHGQAGKELNDHLKVRWHVLGY